MARKAGGLIVLLSMPQGGREGGREERREGASMVGILVSLY